MKHRERPSPLGFDEQRALEDLQHLHREIQRARGERERAEADFDAFLRGCRNGEPAPDVPAVAPPPQAMAVDEQPEPRPDRAQHDVETDWAAPLEASAAPIEPPRPLVAPARPRTVGGRILIPVAALALVATIVAVRARREAGPAADANRTAAVSAPVDDVPGDEAAAEVPPEDASPRPGVPPEAAVSLEIVTRRPVWVRVMVDGRRTIERELEAGQRIPVQADRSVVIRAGDAGALVVRRRGGDEAPLGPDGIVVTREFVAEGVRSAAPAR